VLSGEATYTLFFLVLGLICHTQGEHASHYSVISILLQIDWCLRPTYPITAYQDHVQKNKHVLSEKLGAELSSLCNILYLV